MNWYDILKDLFCRGKIDVVRLESAVTKGLITEAEKNTIISSAA